MQVAVSFKNDTIAQKVLWVLEHFKNDGVDVIDIDNKTNKIVDNFKEGLNEIQLINKGKLSSRPIREFLDEL